MKQILTLLALLVSSVALADDYAYLRVSGSAGDTAFEVSKIEKITFDSTNMIMHLSDGTQQTTALAGLSKMFFSADGTVGIASARSGGMRIENGVLRFDAADGARVTLYNVGGQVVRDFTVSGSKAELNLGDLQHGVYIVKVNGQSLKIMNK